MRNLVLSNTLPAAQVTINEQKWGIVYKDLGWLESAVRRTDRKISETLKNGESMLHVCARDDAEEMCSTLIGSGYNVNAVDAFGQTPLFIALQKGHVEIVQILLDARANPNHADKNLNTPLMAAINANLDIKCDINIKLIEMLLKSGAKINQANKYEETPLKVACIAERTKIAKFLIDNGAVLENE